MTVKNYFIDRIRPLTTFVGKLQVDFIRSSDQFKTNKQILSHFLNTNPPLGVKGPFDQIYIIGPCHDLAALEESFAEKIPIEIIDDYSDLSLIHI